jgi:hypothetical protein
MGHESDSLPLIFARSASRIARLARKLKYPRSADYVCNVFFVPEEAARLETK